MHRIYLSDIMTRQVTTVLPTTTLDKTLDVMYTQKISTVLIVENERPVGIFTERDVLKVLAANIDIFSTVVQAYMTTPVLSLHETMEYREAYYFIAERGIRHLAVTDEKGKLSGIVTESDFLRNLGMEFLLQIKEVGALMVKDVTVLPKDASVDEAIALMRDARSTSVIVEEKRRPIGIISERDIVRFASSHITASKLYEVMTSPVTTVTDRTSIIKAMEIMDEHGFRRLVVVDGDGYTIGILSRHEIVNQLYSRHVELLEESLKANKMKLDIVSQELERERGLHQLESRLSESQRLAHIGSWELDLVSDTIWWSEETYRIFEIDSKKFGATYEAFLKLVHPDDRQMLNDAYTQSVTHKTPYNIVHRLLFDDGRIKYVNERSTTYYDKAGKALYSVGTVQDITEQFQKDEEIERYHAMLMALVEGSTDSIFVKNKEGTYVVGNDALASLLGRSLDTIIGADDFALFPSDVAERFRADDQRIMQNKKVETYEETVVAGGKVLPYQTTKGPLFIDGKVEGVFGIARDISMIKGIEKRLNKLLNTLPYGVQENNLEGVITYSNPAHHHILGMDEDTLLGHHIWDFMQSAEEKEKLRSYLAYLVAEQPDPTPYISNILTKNGRKAKIEVTWDYQYDDFGKLKGFISVLSDITEKKSVEERYKTLFERTGTAMGIVEEDGTFSMVNKTAAKLLETSCDELKGQPFSLFVAEEDLALVQSYHLARIRGEELSEQYEYKFVTSKGNRGTGLMTAVYLPDIKQTVVSVIDVSERKKVQKNYQNLFERTGTAMGIIEEDGTFSMVNQTFAKVAESTPEELTGVSFLDLIDVSERERMSEYHMQRISGNNMPENYEFKFVSKKGKHGIGSLYAVFLPDSRQTIISVMDISEKKKSEKELQEYTWFLESLDKVSKTIAGEHNDAALLQSLSEVILEIYDADRAWFLYPCNPEAAEYKVVAESTQNGFKGADKRDLKMPMNGFVSGVCDHALQLGSPVVNQVEEYEEVPDLVREYEIQSHMVTAIRPELGDAWLMGLHQCSRKREWTEIEIHLFHAITERIGLALSGTLLLKQIRQNERVLLEAEHVARLGHWELDIHSGKAMWSNEIHRITGTNTSQDVGPAFLASIVNPEDWPSVEASLTAAANEGKNHEMEYRIRRPDGEERWLYCKAECQCDENGIPQKLVGIAQDITERKHKAQELKLASVVFENTSEGIMITDNKANIISVNRAFTDITGYTQEEVMGKNPRLLQSHRQGRIFYQQLWHSLETMGSWQGEIWNRMKNGQIYPEWLSMSVVKDNNGEVVNYIGLFSDISDAKKNEEDLLFLATHDPLTNLPNRTLLSEHLEYSLKRLKRHHEYLAVLYLDLDRFKEVNDSLGHPAGDRLLEIVSQRFINVLREEDFIARVSGDEFVIILEDLTKTNDAGKVAEALLEEIRKPMRIDNHDVTMSVSIGIAISPTDGIDSIQLLKNADSALYRAKEKGRNTYSYFSKELAVRNFESMYLHNALYNALDNEEFELYYQPQINMQTGEVVGTEALVRWNSPEMGMVMPGRFIPIAEDTGVILPLGRWVLLQACKQMKKWKESGFSMKRVAVNLSGRQLSQKNIVEDIQNILLETQINPVCLELEITESVVMQDEGYITKLHKLKALGIRISIDDFGTGYSSLSRLKTMPIDKLKIDQSFISGIPVDADNMKITEIIIQLSQSFNIDVIAEGVETKEQENYLIGKGCMDVQGYLYSRPLSAEDLAVWLKERK